MLFSIFKKRFGRTRYLMGATLIEVVVAVVILGAISTLAGVSYSHRKRRVQYNAVLSNVRTIVNSVKTFYLTTGAYAEGADTDQVNSVFCIRIHDDPLGFQNYQVRNGSSPNTFRIYVDYKNTLYARLVFDESGTRIGCTGFNCSQF